MEEQNGEQNADRMKMPTQSQLPTRAFRKLRQAIGTCQVCVALFLTGEARATETYHIIELERGVGFSGFDTARLTEDGRVPGSSSRATPPYRIPTVWDADGSANYLWIPDQTISGHASSLATGGKVIGAIRYAGEDYTVPIVWDGARAIELPLPNRFGWAALASGPWIVGGAIAEDGTTLPAVWHDEGFAGIVANIPGTSCTPFEINSSGTYVGVWSGFNASGQYVYGGFLGNGPTARTVEWSGFPQPRALSINDADTIAGIYLPDGFTRVGYVAHGEDIVALNPLPGEVESPVWAINNNDDLVGLSTDVFGNETATVYFNGSLMPVDMNTLIDPIPGMHLVRGIDINDAGQILVEGADFHAGVYRYYILTPVPEPSAMMVSLAGLMMGMRRRR